MKYRKLSNDGEKFLKHLEGFKNEMYLDSGAQISIGVGHLLTKSERKSGKIKILDQFIRYRNGLTDQQVEDLLSQDLAEYEGTISLSCNDSVCTNWKEYEIDSLICFCFNIGTNAFINSTLRKKLLEGKKEEIPSQMHRWIYDNGVQIKGLKNRRKKETHLFLTGQYMYESIL